MWGFCLSKAVEFKEACDSISDAKPCTCKEKKYGYFWCIWTKLWIIVFAVTVEHYHCPWSQYDTEYEHIGEKKNTFPPASHAE